MERKSSDHPIYIELLGPAGSGKTTLARAIMQGENNVQIIPKPGLRSIKDWEFFFRNLIDILPIIARQRPGRKFLTYREIKWMIFLNGGQNTLEYKLQPTRINLIDHGPIYMLTSLYSFGPPVTQSQTFLQWWGKMLENWASTLNIIIWLDAPNQTLAKRINKRPSSHPVKGQADDNIYAFLSAYRDAFEHVISLAGTSAGRLTVLRFQSDQETTDQIKEKTLSLIRENSSQVI